MKIFALLLLMCGSSMADIRSFTETRSVLQDHLDIMRPGDPLFLEIGAALFHRSLPEILVVATNPQEAAENLNALINIANDVPPKGTDLVTVYYWVDTK